MKEFAMKHPIITFLLADALLTGLFSTIKAFAPDNGKTEESSLEEDKAEAENDTESNLIVHISKEETT